MDDEYSARREAWVRRIVFRRGWAHHILHSDGRPVGRPYESPWSQGRGLPRPPAIDGIYPVLAKVLQNNAP